MNVPSLTPADLWFAAYGVCLVLGLSVGLLFWWKVLR